MAKYRKIDTRIWNDLKFNELSEDGKLIFFLLLTHPHLTPIGAMRATKAGLASELRWSTERFNKAFEEGYLKDMIRHDESAAFIWLPNFLKYNQPESPNVIRSWEHHLDYLPECSLKKALVNDINNFVSGLSEAFKEALPQAFTKSIANQEHEHKQEQEQKDKDTSYTSTCKSGLVSKLKNKTNKLAFHIQKYNSYQAEAVEILNFLNLNADKAFEINQENLKWIIARLRDGETPDVCRQVIIRKNRQWKDDEKMKVYLRPSTLFEKSNFYKYKGELVLPDERLIANV